MNGPRFLDFARRLGVTDQKSAYQLVYLHRYKAQIISHCVDDAADAAKRGQIYRYPGWETALGWFHQTRGIRRSGRYWLTPPALWRKLDAEFHFDYDPCPSRCQRDATHWMRNGGRATTSIRRFTKTMWRRLGANSFRPQSDRAAAKGKTSVLIFPVYDYLSLLLEAGAEIRSLGQVPFRDVDNHRPAPDPANVACSILRPVKP